MSKLGIIGAAGSLGSALAFVMGLGRLFDELALVDAKRSLLESHVIDLGDCLAGAGIKVVGGEWDVLAGADVVIMTASVTNRHVSSRSDYLDANLQLVKTAAARIASLCPGALLINATSPVDVLVMVLARELGWDRRRIMGFSANDSVRFRGAVGAVMDLPPAKIEGVVLGENGETMVPVFSSLKLDGEPLTLSRSQETRVETILAEWNPRWQSLESGRSTSWTTSLVVGQLFKALARQPSSLPWGGPAALPLTGSVMAEGEYGLRDVALGLPLALGSGPGWGGVIELDLLKSERERLRQSALMIRSLYEMTL
jgi:malate/lactate dehydrogenase